MQKRAHWVWEKTDTDRNPIIKPVEPKYIKNCRGEKVINPKWHDNDNGRMGISEIYGHSKAYGE